MMGRPSNRRGDCCPMSGCIASAIADAYYRIMQAELPEIKIELRRSLPHMIQSHLRQERICDVADCVNLRIANAVVEKETTTCCDRLNQMKEDLILLLNEKHGIEKGALPHE